MWSPDECHTRGPPMQVEPHVVHIACRQGNIGREKNLLRHTISAQVHGDQLWSTRLDGSHANAAAVQNPQPVAGWIHDYALHGNELARRIISLGITIEVC